MKCFLRSKGQFIKFAPFNDKIHELEIITMRKDIEDDDALMNEN